MLSREQLIIRVRTIFKKEERDMRENNFSPIIYLNRTHGPKSLVKEIPENKIFQDVPNWFQVYKNLDLLIKLYTVISNDPDLKISFLDWIQNHIQNDNKTISTDDGHHFCYNKSTSGLAFRFLFQIRRLDLAEMALDKRHKNKLKSNDIYDAIKSVLRFEHYKMSEAELSVIERIANALFLESVRLIDVNESFQHNQKAKVISDLINDIRSYRLEKELLENFNYEINMDKERVQKFIKRYGFDQNSANALDKVDESFFDSSEKSFDIRNHLSLLKEVFDSITESTLIDLKSISGENPTKKDKETHTQMKHHFISEKLCFTEGERKLMSAVNSMLNEEKHSLISNREKFRLVRNFTIEFLLLIFTKLAQLKDFEKEGKPK